MTKRQLKILLVEDNPDDVMMARRALERANATAQLSIVRDGQEALDFLYQRGAHSRAPRPDLILLDLKLPKVNGFQVLNEIKQDARLRRIPVIVLTISEEESDMVRAYDSGASGYITKPPTTSEFIKIINTVLDYWKIQEFPP